MYHLWPSALGFRALWMKTVVTLRFARRFLITLAHTDTTELAKISQLHVQVDLQELHQFSFSHNNSLFLSTSLESW